MNMLFEFVLVAGVFGLLAAKKANGWTWFGAVGLYLLSWTFLREGQFFLVTLAWLLFIPISALLLMDRWRQEYLTKPIYKLFKAVLPPMSDTEREALESGSVWWDGQLFSGRPDWKQLLATPAPERSKDEQAFLDGPVNTLCGMLDDWAITHEHKDLPQPVWQFIKDNGFFGMIIPKTYGGLEFSAQAHSDVVMKIASRSVSAAVTVMVPNSLGPAELLLQYGTDKQKDHYLPRLAKGLEIPCFALTGPEAGSDAASMPDKGVVCKGRFEGKEVIGIRLNWEKRYITLGPVATVLGLAFKLYDPDKLLGDDEDIGITLALIPTSTPGIEIGNRHYPLNMVFMNGPNRGKDVFIPLDWIIGGPDMVGKGWMMLMECLSVGRSISLPAMATGAGKLASRATGAYAAVRKQFKMPIGKFEGVSEALARIAGNTYLMDAARELTCTALRLGEKPSVISAIIKYHLTERMRSVVNDAMDIQGGSGICLGPRNLMGRVYQAIPISITVEGANILTRSLIIFGQGALRCHPYILREMQAAQDSNYVRGLTAFDEAFFAHIRHSLSNAVRAFFHGVTRSHFIRTPVQGVAARHYQQLTRMSIAFAILSDFAMLTLGGSLKRRERLSARLGDTLSYLYLGSAAVKRFYDQGSVKEDEPLLHWAVTESLFRAQKGLIELLDNFPIRWLAKVIRFWVFPYGATYAQPSDRLADRVAALILKPGHARERLTHGLFIPTTREDALGRLEYALNKTLEAELILATIRHAMRDKRLAKGDPEKQIVAAVDADVITPAEAEIVRDAIIARREVIQVDDFTPQALQAGGQAWTDQTQSA